MKKRLLGGIDMPQEVSEIADNHDEFEVDLLILDSSNFNYSRAMSISRQFLTYPHNYFKIHISTITISTYALPGDLIERVCKSGSINKRELSVKHNTQNFSFIAYIEHFLSFVLQFSTSFFV